MKILHTSECTKRHQEAEIVAKVNLFDPSCPRCRLNYAAPETAAERDRLKFLNANHRETLLGIAKMPNSDGERMKLWATDALSGYIKTAEASLLNALDERNRLKELNADLLKALVFVQEAIACERDGKVFSHPVHGILSLEEVKYCVVDPAISLPGQKRKENDHLEDTCKCSMG